MKEKIKNMLKDLVEELPSSCKETHNIFTLSDKYKDYDSYLKEEFNNYTFEYINDIIMGETITLSQKSFFTHKGWLKD